MQGLRFAAVALSAFSMSMTFCHLLELPARVSWNAELWIATTVSGGIFRMFGTLGAVIEVAAVGVALWFAVALRLRAGRGRAFDFALAGALLLILAHAAFWLLVAPVNAELARWTPAGYPPDWASWRAQWEYSHALRAVLQCGAFAALLCSALELPGREAIRAGALRAARSPGSPEVHPLNPPELHSR